MGLNKAPQAGQAERGFITEMSRGILYTHAPINDPDAAPNANASKIAAAGGI